MQVWPAFWHFEVHSEPIHAVCWNHHSNAKEGCMAKGTSMRKEKKKPKKKQ